MMDDRRVADYFVIAGLPEHTLPLEDFSRDVSNIKSTHNRAPITDVAVIFPSLNEETPEGYTLISTTPQGHPANLNHGSLRSPSVFLCLRRGRDKPPLVDLGVYYEGTKETVMNDVDVIYKTPYNRCANVNNSGSRTFITYRRARESDPCNTLVVTDICVILQNKGEVHPHTYCKVDKNLNKGMLGSDVFLCYKKSMNRTNSIAYKPATIGRFPLKDHADFPLPQSVALFCLPMGATVECWPSKAGQPEPVFSTFVLTVSDAVEKVYGAAITFYEPYPAEKLSTEEKNTLNIKCNLDLSEQKLNMNKSICILSHWPFFDSFRRFLKYLHKMSFGGPHNIPIERYISHFMQEVPFPSIQRPRILIQLEGNETNPLVQPEDSPLPLCGASFMEFLANLGPDDCLTVLLLALTEQKILVHSLRPDVLTSTAEAISMLIFPFHWQCPYIPLCPLGLSDVLSAPMPFIVGVDSRYFDMYEPPPDVFCVDLDTHTVSSCEEKKVINVKLLPKKPYRVLRSTLNSLFQKLQSPPYKSLKQECEVINTNAALEKYFKLKKIENMIEIEIQEAFLRFMASILKGFRACLRPLMRAPTIGSTDPNALFDIHGFLKSRDKAFHRFYNLLMKTQMFTRFIEERSFVTDKDASLAFFDECTEKVENGDAREARLIESDECQNSERTVYVPLPDITGLPQGAVYSYVKFDALNPTLFHHSQRKQFLSVTSRASPAPSSPMAKRTKQEIRSAQKLAQMHSKDPREWGKCLKSYSYCLWFIHLPAYIKETRFKRKALSSAFDILVRMQYSHLQQLDEVCYRVLMQLCGQYGEPLLAVKLMSHMKNSGVQLNAITYGYYNKAVLESKWPSQNMKTEMWNKLRYAVLVVGHFRHNVKNRPVSVYSESDPASSENGMPEDSVPYKEDVHLATCKLENKESAGGHSDVGYSSLNFDNTQKSLSSINSCSQMPNDTIDSDNMDKHPNEWQASNNGTLPSWNKNVSRDENNKKSSRSLMFENVDFTESNKFRSRTGSIFCDSACMANFNSWNAMRGSTSVNSSAGLLIPSQPMYVDDVFISNDEESAGHVIVSRRKKCSSVGEDSFSDGGHARNGNSTKQSHSTSGQTSQNVQESDIGNELLNSGSYGNDARILSHLSKGSMDELDAALSLQLSCLELNFEEAIKPSSFDNVNCGSSLQTEDSTFAHQDMCSPDANVESNSITNSTTSPTLTPVTQNDPLGVFSTSSPLLSMTMSSSSTRTFSSMSQEFPASLHTNHVLPKDALSCELFRNEPKRRTISMGRSKKGGYLVSGDGGASVPRSATFCDSPRHQVHDTNYCGNLNVESELLHNSLPRSSTVSDTASLNGDEKGTKNSSHIYSQWSALSSKINAFTPTRKSEMLSGGLQTFKSMFNKLSEIKETISSKSFPNTPNKTAHLPKPHEMETKLYEDNIETTERLSRQGSKDILSSVQKSDKITDENFSHQNWLQAPGTLPHVGSEPVLKPSECLAAENYSLHHSSPYGEKIVTARTALEVLITSCTKCHSCLGLLYDEEIMTNWTPEESNLNTRCAFCKSKVVPVLTVVVKDYRSDSIGHGLLSPALSSESMQSAQSISGLSVSPSRKTSVSLDARHEPMFTLDDSLESASVTSSINSPFGSPQKPVGSFFHHRPLERCATNDSWNGSPVSRKVLQSLSSTGITKLDKNAAKRRSLTALDATSATDINELHRDAIKSRLTDVRDGSVSSSIASSSIDICIDGSCEDAAPKDAVYTPITTLDPIIIPYLSPIILRKELETVLEDEGDNCLTQAEFVDRHPIIFWNLLWYCRRINVPTHLPGLCLKAKAINKDRQCPKNWTMANSHHVVIRCMWDNPKLHEELGQPMHMAWNTTQSPLVHALVTETGFINRGVIQQVISGIQCDDISSPLKIMISELRKKGTGYRSRHHSIYRDLLFLCISYIGRQNMNLIAFDQEYRRAFRQLTPSQRHVLHRYDYPPPDGAIYCRQFFGRLEL